MQPNQEMPKGQSMQQNYPMQQGSPMQSNNSQQQNYQTQQNVQMQNPQFEYNNQMQYNQIPQNQLNQQNFQMNQNSQIQQFNQQMPQNPQNQQNSQMQFNQQMPQNQQNSQMQFNQQMPQNQQNPQMQFNQQMPQNPQNQQNSQMQFNQQMPQNPQNQQNCCQMQQNNASLTSSQSRPLPPPLPKNSSQNLYPSMKRASSQRIPLRTSSANGSNCSMSLQQSMQYSSMASMQSMGSSDSEEMQNIQPQQLPPQSQEQQQQLLPQQPQAQQQQSTSSSQNLSQVLAVVYNNITYKVDPELICNASPKVKEMLLPFIQENRLDDAHLEIMGNKFTYRNINNFLKLCQNLPTDVENSEMEEICEIAKLFGAEKIYNTGVTFIRQNLDPNFSVPDNKYDGSDGKKYLYVEDDQHIINHSSALQSNMANDDDDGEDDDEDDDNNEVKQNPSVPSSTDKNESDKSKIDTTKIGSVIYRVKVEKHALRCTVFHFYDDTNVLFTGKQKNENIFIGEGYDVHISSNQKNHVAHITQDDYLHNIIFLKDKNFKLKYVNSGKPNHYSINVTFPLNKDKMITWTPKQPKYDPIKDKYYLNFHGEHHHTPMKSKKNIVLQNDNGHPTFIVRKMDNEMYEIECLPLVDPLIAFVIGLSDIVGPYMDPCGDIVI